MGDIEGDEHAMTGEIVSMKEEHLPSVVEVHRESFPGFFLTFLGPRFLTLLYGSILESPFGGAFVYLERGIVGGFVCGTANPSGFYRSLLRKRAVPFAIAAATAVLRRPSILPRLARAVGYPGQTPKGDSVATLMSIGVRLGMQGKGIGKVLVDRFLAWAAECGIEKVNLTTDGVDNDPVNRFYERYGFSLERTYRTPEGREMNEFGIRTDGIRRPETKA